MYINKENFKNELSNNIIDNKKLLELFGTEKNIENYNKNKRVTGSMKQSMLNRAKQYCNINDTGKGKYEIIEVYKNKINTNVLKILNNQIYSNLAPIIIKKLIDSKIDNNLLLNLSLISYYDLMNLVHKDNYNNIRYRPKTASNSLDLKIESIDSYFKISNEKLRYYLEHCLELLQKSKIIVYIKIPMVKFRHIQLESKHSSVITKVKNIHRRATEEEIRFYEDAVAKICREYKIEQENFNRIFFDPRLENAKKEFNDILIHKGIVYYYRGYEVYYTDIKESEKFMDLFPEFKVKNSISDFINIISENITKSIDSRFKDKILLDDIKFLNQNVLDYSKETLDIENRIKSTVAGEIHYYENIINECED